MMTDASSDVFYRLRGTGLGRSLLRGLSFLRAPREARHRRDVAREFIARGSAVPVDARKGYGLVQPGALTDFEAIRPLCLKLFEVKRAKIEREVAEIATGTSEEQARFRAAKRKFLRNLFSNDDLRRHPELVDFALSDAALGAAARYLGTIPYLNRVDLLYSMPREGDDKIASQLFHVDPEGLSQVKFIINVFPVGEPEGPFTFIPADETDRILRAIRALRQRRGTPHVGRYLDEEIEAVGGTGAIVKVSGGVGSGIAVDTSRCMHMGSRVAPGAFRLCLYLQYCTSLEAGNVFDIKRFKKDRVRHLAVAHSLRSEGTEVRAPHDAN